MNTRDLRNTLNYYNGSVPVRIRVGRKEYEITRAELSHQVVRDDDYDEREVQTVVLIAEED